MQIRIQSFFSLLQVNCFPSTAALDRKDKLWNCYKKFQAKVGKKACNFIPENYNLPQQKAQLMAKVSSMTADCMTADCMTAWLGCCRCGSTRAASGS